MFEQLVNKLIAYCEKKNKVFYITGTGNDRDIYLIRYYVLPRNRFFNFYIHTFLRSDRDDMHDHPWDFATYLVRGQYTEETPLRSKEYGFEHLAWTDTYFNKTVRNTSQNRLAFRRAENFHRVMLDRPYEYTERHLAPTTVFFSGPTRRTWGFIKDGRWVEWKTYLNLPKNAAER